MKIDILGTGCPKCAMLMNRVQQALSELELSAEVSKIDKINDIINYGVMSTPALAIDGKVKIAGKVPSIEDLKNIIKKG